MPGGMVTTATVYEGGLEMASLQDRILLGLLSGTFSGLLFKDLPDRVQGGLEDVIQIMRDHCASDDW